MDMNLSKHWEILESDVQQSVVLQRLSHDLATEQQQILTKFSDGI